MNYDQIVAVAREIIQDCWDTRAGDAVDFTCNVINMTSVALTLQTYHDVPEDIADEAAMDKSAFPWAND